MLQVTAKITPPQQPPAGPEEIKPLVNAGMRKLRYYTGPSHTWFSYQRSLATGAGMIADAVGRLPPTKENARYLWQLIERIDKKLANGVDDSDGDVVTSQPELKVRATIDPSETFVILSQLEL